MRHENIAMKENITTENINDKHEGKARLQEGDRASGEAINKGEEATAAKAKRDRTEANTAAEGNIITENITTGNITAEGHTATEGNISTANIDTETNIVMDV